MPRSRRPDERDGVSALGVVIICWACASTPSRTDSIRAPRDGKLVHRHSPPKKYEPPGPGLRFGLSRVTSCVSRDVFAIRAGN